MYPQQEDMVRGNEKLRRMHEDQRNMGPVDGRDPAIQRIVNVIDEKLGHLGATIEGLESRLQGVLCPLPPAGPDNPNGRAPEPPMSPLTNRLHDFSLQLDRLTNIVSSLRDRAEV